MNTSFENHIVEDLMSLALEMSTNVSHFKQVEHIGWEDAEVCEELVEQADKAVLLITKLHMYNYFKGKEQ